MNRGHFSIFSGSLALLVREISNEPSRPGEFHPQPLTEPYMNLSAHTARASHSLKASRPRADTEKNSLLP